MLSLKRSVLFWLSLSSLAFSSCLAFAPSSSRRTASKTSGSVTVVASTVSNDSDKHLTDRKSFLQTVVLSFLGSSTLLVLPTNAAYADVTNKVASSSALRNVKLVQKKLAGLQVVVQENEYQELKEALRVAPFSDLRKSMSTLVKGGEDGPDAELLQTKYKTFIARLEKMDGTASLALRGKKLSEGEFTSTYQATVDALADFLETASAAAEIPVQYSDSS